MNLVESPTGEEEVPTRFAPVPPVNSRQMWANNRFWMESQRLVTKRFGRKRSQHWDGSAGQPAKRRGRPPKDTSRVVLAGVDPHSPVQAFLDRFAVEQAERRRKQNTKSNDRKREREFAAAKARGSERTSSVRRC